eukprot:scaffold174665_cov31-Tisochrysis_lutea.AAC.2
MRTFGRSVPQPTTARSACRQCASWSRNGPNVGRSRTTQSREAWARPMCARAQCPLALATLATAAEARRLGAEPNSGVASGMDV